jgi:hypothetical protein
VYPDAYMRVSGANFRTRSGPRPAEAAEADRGLYLRLVVDTSRGTLTAYLNGRVLKRWPYKLLNEQPTPDYAAAGGCGRQFAGATVADG